MPTTITGNTGVSQVQAGATSDGLPMFQCRAWVNFDGTKDSTGAASTANTARFIRASGNVSSVVRNGTGDYTVNFTTAMPDANYCVTGTTVNFLQDYRTGTAGSVSSVKIRTLTVTTSPVPVDQDYINVAIFR